MSPHHHHRLHHPLHISQLMRTPSDLHLLTCPQGQCHPTLQTTSTSIKTPMTYHTSLLHLHIYQQAVHQPTQRTTSTSTKIRLRTYPIEPSHPIQQIPCTSTKVQKRQSQPCIPQDHPARLCIKIVLLPSSRLFYLPRQPPQDTSPLPLSPIIHPRPHPALASRSTSRRSSTSPRERPAGRMWTSLMIRRVFQRKCPGI